MINRKSLLLIFVLCVPTTAHPIPYTTLTQIADAYERDYFDHNPEEGLHLGRQNVVLDRFRDHSLHEHQKWQKQEDDFLRALQQLDVALLKGTPQHQTYQLLKEKLESSQATRVCRDELWNINPLWGWHIMLGMLADKQPIGTQQYRQSALKRWQGFDRVVQDEIANLRQGLKEGYTAPQPVVKTVIKQIKMILSMPYEQSPYFDFAKRDDDLEFKKQVTEIVAKIINPALKGYVDYLENEYLPVARTAIGVSALPNGEQCYLAKIKENSTLSLTAQEVYEYGLQHNQTLSDEITKVGAQQFGIKQPTEILHLVKMQKKKVFHTEQEILAFNQATLNNAKAAMPKWFSALPKSEAIIKPYPIHRAKSGAAGEYDRPSKDGKRPGIFYINTYEPQNITVIGQQAILFHELIPGHHLQIALAMENQTGHSLDAYLWNNGYEEGWALYAERLADEMNLYTDNISRLGMLANESLRTARLVVDPGIHIKQWSREQAIAYLEQHTLLDDHIIEGEVDRYIMLPGQAVSYMLGKREIDSLRQIANTTLGEQFDIKEFHYQILKNGSVTLPMLRDNILNWLSSDEPIRKYQTD